MKKLNIKNLSKILFPLAFLFATCTDLEEDTYQVIPMDSFGTTVAEAASLIGPVYQDMRFWYWRWMENTPGVMGLSEFASDMALVPTRRGGDWWDGGEKKALRQGNWVADTRHLQLCWDGFMGAATRTNRVIYMIENNPVIPDKAPYVNQCRFARAFWYWVLLDNFGNVPLVTNFEDVELPSTTPRAQVYQYVLGEINAIKDLLPAKSASNYGSFTKGAAYALLAKLYLNAEVYDPAGGPKWQECIDACDEVMGMGYILEPDRKANFSVNNEGSKENILTALYHTDNRAGMGMNLSLHYLGGRLAMGLLMTGANGLCAMPGYVAEYDPDDKRLQWDFLQGPQINLSTGQVVITAHGRPLIYTPTVTMKYGIDADGWGQVEQEDGYRIGKWEYSKSASQMENDGSIFRLADILLMKAECLVRLNIDNDVATGLVNQVRQRAFDDPAKLFATVTLEDIYKERRFELAWEGHTRQDMIRFGTYGDPIPGWRGELPEYRWIFPIPTTALNKNPNLDQNPGYN